MRLSVTSLALVAALVVLPLFAAEPDDAKRLVEIQHAKTAARADLLKELQPLDFEPLTGATDPAGVLRGRLPGKSVAKVAETAGVTRVTVGPVEPPPAPALKDYDVQIRYQIDANLKREGLERIRNPQRELLYKAMLKELEAAGFKKKPGLPDEEFYSDYLAGTVPASAADKLFKDAHVQSALLVPAGLEFPPDKPVLVEMLLITNLPSRQKEIAERTREWLKAFRFQEGAGYDHRSFTRLLGWLPAQELQNEANGRPPGLLRDDTLLDLPAAGQPEARVNIEVQFQRAFVTSRDEVLTDLMNLGFVLIPGADDPPDVLRGRMPEKLVANVSKIEGVKRVLAGSPTTRVQPIRRVRVLREPEKESGPIPVPAEPQPLPKEQQYLEKIAPDLRDWYGKWAALPDDDPKKRILVRVEVLLRTRPTTEDADWAALLKARSLIIDGRIGPLVTGLLDPAQLTALASQTDISTVRFPQDARPLVLPPFDARNPERLPVDFAPLGRENQEVGDLAALVRRRQPQRSAVIASDFRNYQQFVGKPLPAKTQLLDLTAERNRDLVPDKETGAADEVGEGTRLAMALVQAAPAEELFLVRIDPAAPFQVEEVARMIQEGSWRTDSLPRRESEIRLEDQQLEEQRTELRIERKVVLDTFRDDPFSKAAKDDYMKRQQQFDELDKAHRAKVARLLNLIQQGEALRRVSTVLVGLQWSDGHPALAGETPTTRFLDPNLLRSASWIQVVPRAGRQVWSGLFVDVNKDGAMEFTVADSAGRRGDLNFLAWEPYRWGKETPAKPQPAEIVYQELPAKAWVQITVQWREVHSPEWNQDRNEDAYRQPLVSPQIEVLRQRDPAGQVLPPEVFEVVARSSGLPDRVENHPRYAIYQATLRFLVPDQPGRYVVRVLGRGPESTLPAEAAKVPRQEQWELHPRLSVELLDYEGGPNLRGQGRVVLEGH